MYTVPESRKDLPESWFEFQFPNDERSYRLPKIKFIRPDLLTQLEELAPTTAFRTLIETYEPDLIPKFDDVEQLEALMKEWERVSAITLGESAPSV